MSFQAYLDNVEIKTGKTPTEFIAIAKKRGYDQPGVLYQETSISGVAERQGH